ncbi:unnamed protein product, partial [Discosporangium mesarthrocarpum]
LSYEEVLTLWAESPDFAIYFKAMLLEHVPFEAFFWESVPVTPNSLGKPYQFVVSNSEFLAHCSPMCLPMYTYCTENDPGTTAVVTFQNLGRDATLVVPCAAPNSVPTNYAHLAGFLRTAPKEQVGPC